MPIYEYQAEIPEKGCKICRESLEYIQGVGEKALSHCPHCGERVKKIISWCHAAVIDPAPEYTRVERKIVEYEKAGMYSHAAELADKHSHKIKDRLLKERALEDYKKAGYDLDSTPTVDSC
jgi:putative FmdB family regulatory protein